MQAKIEVSALSFEGKAGSGTASAQQESRQQNNENRLLPRRRQGK